MKVLIDDVSSAVDDVKNTDFEYFTTKGVPSSDDGALTLERGVTKKGKVLDTCVLFVDIRNSVALTEKHDRLTMAKIYTAFTKSMVKAAAAHGGFIRNVIGDRVMIVFPHEGCFQNAVDCAISINHISQYIINKKFTKVDFKCGIGIDYGKIRVIKVGQSRKGKERGENKGLVWVGSVANYASRLTDMANKKIEKTNYLVSYHPLSISSLYGLGSVFSNYLSYSNVHTNNSSPYAENVVTSTWTPEEFAEQVRVDKDGSFGISRGKYVRHLKQNESIAYPAILMTETVFKGFVKQCPERKHKLWEKQSQKIGDVKDDIYGGNIIWKNLI